MVEFDMQRLLWRDFTKKDKAKFLFYNIYWPYNTTKIECDFLVFTDSDYSEEFEIKCTKADFKEEFETKKSKHELLKARDSSCPNKYWFAAPKGILNKEDIPEYAGFVELVKEMGSEEYKVRVVKRAPLLHEYLIEPKELFTKIYYKYHRFVDELFQNPRKRIRKADGTKTVEKKRSRKPKKRFFTVNKKVSPGNE